METGSIAEKLSSVKRLYEVGNIPNRVVDGNESFPENEQSLEMGISVEFRYFPCSQYLAVLFTDQSRNVTFKYPGNDSYALHNVSFKIEKGQLCVRIFEYLVVVAEEVSRLLSVRMAPEKAQF
jgi:ABC-type multidrug transport system fused ATPase/permease subunit